MTDIRKKLDKITNKRLLVVFPHPDDESVMAGGLILAALGLGWQVSVLTLTEGGSGKIHINGRGRSVREIRREEMAQAMSKLGVMDWVMWHFDDGRLQWTKTWRERLSRFVEIINPGLVVTYDLSGVSGHPDHISLSLEILRSFRKQRGFKLFWTSFEGEMEDRLVDKRVSQYLQKAVMYLDLSWWNSFRKWSAVFAHRSQNLGSYLRESMWRLVFLRRTEWYSEAKIQKRYKYKMVRFKI